MKYVMLLVELHGRQINQYLKSYDPEAHDGQGYVTATMLLSDAMKFDTAEQAMALWRSVSPTRPRRDDGKPNRPLAAFTVSIQREDHV